MSIEQTAPLKIEVETEVVLKTISVMDLPAGKTLDEVKSWGVDWGVIEITWEDDTIFRKKLDQIDPEAMSKIEAPASASVRHASLVRPSREPQKNHYEGDDGYEFDPELAEQFPLMYAAPGTRQVDKHGVEFIRMQDDDKLHIHMCALNTATGKVLHTSRIEQ